MPIQLLAKQAGLEHSRNLIGSFVPMNQLPELLISTLAFCIIGLLLFALAFWIMDKAMPFSIRKEIEEDQNTALAIVIASVIIGIGLIVSAAVHG